MHYAILQCASQRVSLVYYNIIPVAFLLIAVFGMLAYCTFQLLWRNYCHCM